jgi:hypothetical protein
MNKTVEVLNFLIPDGGWILNGEEYEGITFLNCEPITKKQYEDGFAQYDAWKAQQESEKAALLARLGITADEAKLLLS